MKLPLSVAGAIAAVVLSAQPVWPAAQESIIYTPHNLSASGPGPVKAQTESEVCIFCHTAHRAGVTPLWNRSLPNTAYITYKSSTVNAVAGQPTGSSKLCLSCHDGTIALGRVMSRPAPIPMSGSDVPRGRKNLGTDISNDHPVSVSYNQAQGAQPHRYRAAPMPVGGQMLLDENGMVQCTSCHDPHHNSYGKFLVMDNREGRLCLNCHVMDEWSLSSHNTSMARWNGLGRDPWPYTDYDDVRSNGCANCHSIHDAGGAQHLLYYAQQAENCFSCHNGAVAQKDVHADFEKPYRHRVEAVNSDHAHPVGRDFDPSQVGCTDCHNPHAANTDVGDGRRFEGALRGVLGLSASGGVLAETQEEHEICYKCHALASKRSITRPLRRLHFSSSLRDKFSASGVSFHPVEAVGHNPDVPSLIPPLSETSLIRCTDCHNNDSRTDVRGPHGSRFRFLLESRYETGDQVGESAESYALCYKCHDRMSILSDYSFGQHRKHVVDQRTPCSVCHDSHGISRTEGTSVGNSHLINFDVTVVKPDPLSGRIDYVSEGSRKGSCFLSCHGKNHSPESY